MDHVAIDLSLSKSQICVRAGDGTILEERACLTRTLEQFFARRPRSRVVLESSAEAFAIADLAKGYGHEVTVVPSVLVRALGVGARGVKNDRDDARATSQASCQMSQLPSVHVPSLAAREIKAMCTSREGLVEGRTKLVNSVRGFLRTQLIAVKKGYPETFPSRAREPLSTRPDGIPRHIERSLLLIEAFNGQIKAADKELLQLTRDHEICRRLMTVPGVGPVTAARFYAAVDDVTRFANAHQLESYFGLTPGENITGFKGHRTRLTKAGSADVRWALVQAAWSAIRTRPNDPMVSWATELAARRGRMIAAVALARKMAGILYAIWRDGTVYNPQRGAGTTTAAQ